MVSDFSAFVCVPGDLNDNQQKILVKTKRLCVISAIFAKTKFIL